MAINQSTLTSFGITDKDAIPSQIAFIAPDTFYSVYYQNIPKSFPKDSLQKPAENFLASLEKNSKENLTIKDSFVRQWILFEPSPTTEAIMVKLSSLNKVKWQGHALDIRTMYETGSQMLQLEQALNFLFFPVTLVMLGIILIGVINTLSLAIRERTREIGTIRAIGFSRSQVLAIFMMESTLLATIASVLALIVSLILMTLISAIPIETESSMSMMLNQGHIYFKNKPSTFLIIMFFTILVTSITAFFPATKAAKLKPSEALEHYE